MLLKSILYYLVMIIRALSEPNKKSIFWAMGWAVLVLLLSFKAPSVNPKYIFPYQDKVVHFMFYFVFVFLWSRYLYASQKLNAKMLFRLFVFTIIFAGLIEIAQETLTTNRHAELLDMLANLLGALSSSYFVSKFFLIK